MICSDIINSLTVGCVQSRLQDTLLRSARFIIQIQARLSKNIIIFHSTLAGKLMVDTFTPLYDWVARRTDLTLLEKIIICKVLRYGNNGCYESYANLAKDFAVDRRNLIRTVKGLIKKDWLAVLYESKNRRILYIVPERLSPGPLFNRVVLSHSHSGIKAPGSGIKPPNDTCIIHKERKKIQTTVDSLAEVMTDKAKPTRKEFEQMKQQQIRALLEK